ncbi:MAG TPA: phosphate ABC transporter permease subunit PstC [Dehalococcoidia bacterium]|nr:phosphate ABC transporter permease subunit PstC [Dehalococcoidia bacterium]
MAKPAGSLESSRRGLAPRRGAIHGEPLFRAAVALAALLVLGTVLGLAALLTYKSWSSIRTFGGGFLVNQTWDPIHKQFGALPDIYGTLVTSAMAIVLASFIGVGAALCLTDLAPRRIAGTLSALVELLAAIPSVVYGLWGIFVLAPLLREYVEPFLHHTLGFVPIFSGPEIGIGLFAGGIILAIMILPTVTAISRDVIRAVPLEQREAAAGLGATHWEIMWKVVLPYARPGIIGALILGLGRALGETIAVTMVVGARPQITHELFGLGYTIAAVIANEFAEATYNLYLSALFELGLVLLLITMLLNILARLLIWRVSRGPAGAL